MGFIRDGGVIILSILLLLSLLVGNVFLIVSSSLEYENLQEKMTPVIETAIYENVTKSELGVSFDILEKGCEQGMESKIQKNLPITISCDTIKSSTAETIVENFIHEIYYKDYECGFMDCFGKEEIPFFLISEQTKEYVQNKYYYALAIALLLLIFSALLVGDKRNILVIVGIVLILSSIPFMKISGVFGIDPEIATLFLDQAHTIFWWMLVIGIIVLGAGIGLRFWNFEKAKEIFERKTPKKKK